MDDHHRAKLDALGRFLVEKMRDAPIDFYDRLVDGHWKPEQLQRMSTALGDLSAEQRAVVREVVVETVDHALHAFLFALVEENDFNRRVTLSVDGTNAVEISDGLHGEPLGSDGWLATFSRHGAR